LTAFASAGDILGERYALRQNVWRSALGPVWLARDRTLERTVLVQLLAAEIETERAARRAFQKAASRTAQATHAGLLQVYDIGDDPAFVVFEYAAGGRLADRLRTGPLGTTEAARAALAVARALEALHERGAWHGALSPAAVLFDEEGRAKLLTDGVSEVARALGKPDLPEQPPAYRPPERDPLPADADRYALAALTAHMFTGALPVRGTSPKQQRRSVPADVDALLQRALSADPGARPTIDAFESTLGPFARVVPREPWRPRIRLTQLGWLIPVIVVLVLAVLAATFGVQLARDFAKKTAPTPRPRTSVTTGAAVEVASATDFDPEGNKEEQPNKVPLAIDGDPGTAWQTVGYRDAGLGGKAGVGLIFDLGSSRKLARVRVQSTLPGWEAEIRVADEQAATHKAYELATTFTAGRDTVVSLPSSTKGQFLLLWITKLTDDGGGSQFPFRAAVAEVSVFSS
jgi:hypothetical protein